MGRSRRFSSKPGLLVSLALLVGVGVLAWSATLFEDDFDPPQPGWLLGPDPQGNAVWSASEGIYQVLLTRPNAFSTSLAPAGSFSEFCLEGVVQQAFNNPSHAEVGLLFAGSGEEEPASALTFGVFPDGSYRLGRWSDGALVDLPVATPPLKLRREGANNVLRVVVRQDEVRFLANGELLATLQREAQGEVGFFGRSPAQAFTAGFFDAIRVMTPDCEP